MAQRDIEFGDGTEVSGDTVREAFQKIQSNTSEIYSNVSDLDASSHSHANSSILEATTASYTTAAESKLAGIEPNATADQTAAEIAASYATQVPQVTSSEREAGTETALRSFSPADVSSMIGAIKTTRVTIADDAVATIETPGAGGVFFIYKTHPSYPQVGNSMAGYFDTGLSPGIFTFSVGGTASNQGSTVLTGTTGPQPGISVSARPSQELLLENRTGTTSEFSVTILGT